MEGKAQAEQKTQIADQRYAENRAAMKQDATSATLPATQDDLNRNLDNEESEAPEEEGGAKKNARAIQDDTRSGGADESGRTEAPGGS